MEEKTLALPNVTTILKIFLPALSFSIPFIFSGPQIITGSVVNSLLIVGSFKLSKKTLWPTIVLPSIGAVLHGVVFGPFTPFLVFFLPWIWLGNFVLVSSFSAFKKTFPYPLTLIVSSVLKTTVLYSFALIYFHFNLIPKLFLSSMGIFQLFTAISGGILAYILLKTFKNG
ncbi:MAG: hypothetical protein A2152_02525 [Candidatus Levybacteria bacterium RBG_16_35_6]|nr:MAG: hypothetical protein A2152_02525 [Candidatus Levybacteria bacterium RBG_16_35_6]